VFIREICGKKLKDSAGSIVHRVLSMELILIRYGLLAVFVAAMIEADVIPVLAGVAAHHGYFNPPFAVAVASCGALAGDCIWFYIGRHNLIRKSTTLQQIKSKAEVLFKKVGHWQIPASHVIYGTRVATMTFMGARGSRVGKFVLLDGMSCLALTTVLFCLGFALSASVSLVLINVRRVEVVLLITVAAVALILHLLGRRILQGNANV